MFADTAAAFSARLGARRRVLLTFLGMSLPLCLFEKFMPAVQNDVTVKFVRHPTQAQEEDLPVLACE